MLTPEQLEARKGKITSSIAAACLGIHPYITSMGAKRRILGLDAFEGNKATERGNRLEEIILRYPAEVKSLWARMVPFRLHPDHKWSGDSCDAAYYKEQDFYDISKWPVALGEGKTVSMGAADGYGEEGTDQVPAHVLVQCHWHLIHWPEVDLCYVPVLVGGYTFEFRLYEVHRDREIEDRLLKSLEKWHHDYIVFDKDPPVTAGDLDCLRERYPESTSPLEYVDAGGELDGIVCKYLEAKENTKNAKSTENFLRARLQQAIGSREGLESDGWRVTHRNNKPSQKIDFEALAHKLLDTHCNQEQKDHMLCAYAQTVPGARVLRATMKGVK